MNAILAFLAVSLMWDWNTEPHLGGYVIYYGEISNIPPVQRLVAWDVGKVNAKNIDDVVAKMNPGATLYFVVTAYNTDNQEGKPSNEVSYKKPEPIVATPTPLPTPTPPVVVPPHTHAWQDITGKPETFPNEPHTHVIPATESSQ